MTRNIVLMSLDIKQVAEFDIPEFEDNPEVIMWDGRAFTTKHGCALNVYFEAPLYTIPQQPSLRANPSHIELGNSQDSEGSEGGESAVTKPLMGSHREESHV